MKQLVTFLINTALLITTVLVPSSNVLAEKAKRLSWDELPSRPDELGVAGPFAEYTTTHWSSRVEPIFQPRNHRPSNNLCTA